MRTKLALILTLIFCVFSGITAHAEDTPAPIAAKLLQIMSQNLGQNGKVSTKDGALAGELSKNGKLDNNSRLVYVTTLSEVKAYAARNSCVVVNDPKLLSAGATVALINEGGKTKFFLSKKNMEIFGITFPDSIMRIATFV